VSDLLIALGATGLSMGIMYVVCLRPMRRHRGRASQSGVDPAREQLAAMRREVASLREQARAP
jgi:hypothetical protein